MNTPYYHSPASTPWWSRSKSSSKLTKEKPRETALSRTYSALQADGLIPDRPTRQSSMFGNLTSAIRLRTKRNTRTPPVHEPPKVLSPLIIPPSNPVEPYGPLTSRPFSKAVSAVTVTDEGSIEPKTPLDLRLSYQKSLVDADPFAAATGVMLSSPKEAQDLEQLFIPPDPKPTKASPVSPRTTFKRPHTANPQPIRERLVSESTVPSRRLVANRPTLTVRTPPDILNTRPNLRTRNMSTNDGPAPTPVTLSPVTPASPATYGRAKSKSTDGPRPHTRPRGMTDTSGLRPSLRKDLPPLTRQPSFTRSVITPPGTSPPSQALPPVPSLKYLSVSRGPDRSPTDPGSSSSSSLSFASSISEYDLISKNVCVEDRRLQSIRDQAKVVPEPRAKSPTRILRGALSPTLSRRSPTAEDRLNALKKMPSQPSLQCKLTGPPPGYPDDRSLGADDVLGSPKSLKQQRSFHHPRAPVPPLPALRHATSFTPSEVSTSQSVDWSKDRERQKDKRESAASVSKRRFLPGSMRLGSTSHAATFIFDDDTGSLIIPPSEFDSRPDGSSPPRFTNPFGSPGVESMMLPATSSFYDDLAGSPTTISHFPQSTEPPPLEAGPQQILSAAQLLKLEEMLENDDPDVSSDPSSPTSPSELGSPGVATPALPPAFEEFGFNHGYPLRKTSWTDSIVSSSTVFSSTFSDKVAFSDKVETGSTLSFFDQQQHPGYRPRTTSGNLTPMESTFLAKRSHSALASPSQSAVSMGIESTFGIEPNQPLGGLTPPPRLRPKVAAGARTLGNRGSMAHIQPLSPPPLRRNPTGTSSISSRSTSSKSSSSRKEAKPPPPTFKNDPPVKGIMRKPSFLDIDDDVEPDVRSSAQVLVGGDPYQRNVSISSIDDSFLDLGRENTSFETIRTLSVEGPG